MKKVVKMFTVLGMGALLVGLAVDAVEKQWEQQAKKQQGKRREEWWGQQSEKQQVKQKEETQDRKRSHRFYGPYEAYLKRPLDFAAALLGLLFLSPALAILALLVKVKLGRPVIFTQERPGRIDQNTGKEEIFKLYKLRTMTDERDENGKLLPDETRLTKFGKKLRAASLDELPELFNILKGEMSLVGPRPLLVEYLPRYNERQARRHEVRPGLTGLAQISGRNGLSWEERFEDDVEYVDHITFLTDMKILLGTIGTVLQRKGIHSDTSVTMEAFMGSGNRKADRLLG